MNKINIFLTIIIVFGFLSGEASAQTLNSGIMPANGATANLGGATVGLNGSPNQIISTTVTGTTINGIPNQNSVTPYPTPPASATFFSNLQNQTVSGAQPWAGCADTACAGGTQTGTLVPPVFGVSSPSLSGSAMKITCNGNNPGAVNCLFYRGLPLGTGPTETASQNTYGAMTINVPLPTVSGNSLIITASTSGAAPTTTQVYIDGNLAFNNGTSVTSISYTTPALSLGLHTIGVKAFDAAGDAPIVTITYRLGVPSNANRILLITNLYVTANSAVQGYEADPDFFRNGWAYLLSVQCDVGGSGRWRLWDELPDYWIATLVPCTNSFTPGWHQIVLYGTMDQTNHVYYYEYVAFDNQVIISGTHQVFGARNRGVPDNANTQMQIDLTSAGLSYSAYFDNINIWYWNQ